MKSKKAKGFSLKEKYVPEVNRNNVYGMYKPGGLDLPSVEYGEVEPPSHR